MPQSQLPSNPDLITVLTVFVVSVISGVVSITRKVVTGTPASIVWLISEFLAAILCGWLAYDTYDHLKPYLPDWITLIVFVSVCAYSGGRLLQTAEQILDSRLPSAVKDFRKINR